MGFTRLYIGIIMAVFIYHIPSFAGPAMFRRLFSFINYAYLTLLKRNLEFFRKSEKSLLALGLGILMRTLSVQKRKSE